MCSIMFLCRIDILVSQYVSYQINITCFLIQCCAIGTAQFMRCDVFDCSYQSGIFFYKIFHTPHIDPAVLHGQKHCFRTAFLWFHFQPFIQIGIQCFRYFISKINHDFGTTFPVHFNAVVFRIDIIQIQTDTFRYTDTGTK